MLVRLRIELGDTPGALAAVAGVIAGHGGNITAIDVLDVIDESRPIVVDEVTVEFLADVDLAAVRAGIEEHGARVVSHQTAHPADLFIGMLRRITDALRGDAGDRDEALRRSAGELCATPAVWVHLAERAGDYDAGRTALDNPGHAIVVRSTESLPDVGEAIPGDAWLLAVADHRVEDQRVLVIARPVDQRFTSTEGSRIEALVALYEHLDTSHPASL